MLSISNRPLIFSESNKFDSLNQIIFKAIVTIAAEVQEAVGYLEETIYNNLNITTKTIKFQTTALTSILSSISTLSSDNFWNLDQLLVQSRGQEMPG